MRYLIYSHLDLDLRDQNARTTGGLDLLFGATAEETGLDDDGLFREATLAQDLAKSLQSSQI